MANVTNRSSYENRVASPASTLNGSISSQALELADRTLQIAAGSAAGYFYPVEMLRGALCGTACRLIFSQNPPHPDPRMTRATRITSILVTVVFAAYTLATPKAHGFVPFFLGLGAGISGHDLLRKYIG